MNAPRSLPDARTVAILNAMNAAEWHHIRDAMQMFYGARGIAEGEAAHDFVHCLTFGPESAEAENVEAAAAELAGFFETMRDAAADHQERNGDNADMEYDMRRNG